MREEDMHKCMWEIHEIKDERLETSFEDLDLEEISSKSDGNNSSIQKDNNAKRFRILPRSHSDRSILQKDNFSKENKRFLPRSHSDPVLQSAGKSNTKIEKSCTFGSISLPKMKNVPSFTRYKRSMKIPKHLRSSHCKKNLLCNSVLFQQ